MSRDFIPQNIRDKYKTVWEIKMKDVPYYGMLNNEVGNVHLLLRSNNNSGNLKWRIIQIFLNLWS
jgi:hypothetical protein